MEQNERIRIMLAALARVAWADGRLLPGEVDFLMAAVDGLNLSAEESSKVWRSITTAAVTDEPIEVARLSRDDQEHLIELCYGIATADGKVADEELLVVRELAEACDIDWSDALNMFGATDAE